MKSLLYSFLLLGFFTFSQCKKKSTNPIDELPPETQTGANTFGCLVDGKAFKPGGASLSGGSLQCNYQYLGNQVGGGYFFVVKGTNQSDAGVFSVSLFIDSLQIFQGNKLTLRSRINGNASASYFKSPTNPYYEIYKTGSTNFLGEIWVKKFDTLNQIVSGTFWFDAVNNSGQKVEIREGRFDMRYTR